MQTPIFDIEKPLWNINLLLNQEDDVENEDEETEEVHSAQGNGKILTPDVNYDIFNEEHTAVNLSYSEAISRFFRL
jgi:hypothetical protein